MSIAIQPAHGDLPRKTPTLSFLFELPQSWAYWPSRFREKWAAHWCQIARKYARKAALIDAIVSRKRNAFNKLRGKSHTHPPLFSHPQAAPDPVIGHCSCLPIRLRGVETRRFSAHTAPPPEISGEANDLLRKVRKKWSGRADSNCRPLAPQASALPG